MAGLPKRFARMGFKRGWRAFKASTSRPTSSVRRRVSRSTPRQRAVVNQVAKRRRKKVGFRRSKSGGGFSVTDAALFGAGYGVARLKAHEMAASVLPSVDTRLTLGAVGALAAWKGSGMVKKAGLAVLITEAAGKGATLGAGLLSGVQASGSNAADNGWV